MRIHELLKKIILSGILIFLGVVSPAFSQAIQAEDVYQMSLAELQQMFYKPEIRDKISVKFEEETLVESLKQIAEETGLKLTYRGDIVKDSPAKRIDLENENISVSEALEHILKDTGLDYSISKDGYLLIRENALSEEDLEFQESVSGKITDANNNESIPGANILVQGTSTGTTS